MLGLLRESRRLADGKLHLYVLNIGQGDAILLRTPRGRHILIDGGPDLTVLEELGKHLSYFRRRIDLLVLTHPDKDHVAGLPEAVRRHHIDRVMLTGVERALPRYAELIDVLDERNNPLIVPNPQEDIDLGDGVLIDVLWPDAATMDPGMETNRSSIVLRILYGPHAVMLTGDADEWTETQILASGAPVRSTVLKLGHHGSRTSTATSFLLAVQPMLAIVSAGKDNAYGHPHPSILARLKSLGIPVRSTMEEGTIELEF